MSLYAVTIEHVVRIRRTEIASVTLSKYMYQHLCVM